MSESMTDDHRRIAPTARVMAYFRSFSDIPYAREISRLLDGERTVREIHHDDLDAVTRFYAPVLESRYKCFSPFTRAYSNVLEVAMGLSVERGLTLTSNPDNVYIGTDLPDIITESQALVQTLSPKRIENLHLCAANALSYEQLLAATSVLGGHRRLLIIHEGLWMYLSSDERTILADNMRRLLEKHGGEWVTPDIDDVESSAAFVSSLWPEVQSVLRRLQDETAQLTGRDVLKSLFASSREAEAFFHKAGLTARRDYTVHTPASLVSTRQLLSERQSALFEAALRHRPVWIMSLR